MLKKALFIDRDGTLIEEPPIDKQVDSLEKLRFIPKAIRALGDIRQRLDFELVMATNQDGLGTPSFPREQFEAPHHKMLDILAGEGVRFDDMLIDDTFPHQNAPTRKPGTGLFGKYLAGQYDLPNCWVIGDRLTDMELAKNLGCKGIWFVPQGQADALPEHLRPLVPLVSDDWDRLLDFLALGQRVAETRRTTHETDISIRLDLDGTGRSDIATGLPFFDHMLDQLARHSLCDLRVQVKGDLQVDEHHTIEDTALALGATLRQALGDKRGIERYGFCLPMDDCLAQVALDFGGRPWLVWEAQFHREKIGEMPTEMFFHFFKSLSDAAACNLNIKAEGQNEHHKIESIFKALAKALKMAKRRDPRAAFLPTTKGTL